MAPFFKELKPQHLFWHIIYTYRRSLLSTACITIIWSIDDSAIRPYVLKLLIDTMGAGAMSTSWYQLIFIASLYVALRLLVTGLMRLSDWIAIRMVPAIKQTALELLATHALGHAALFTQKQLTGALAGSLSAAAEGSAQFLTPFVGRLLGSGCRVLFATATLWLTIPSIAALVSSWVVLVLGGGLIWSIRAHHLADQASKKQVTVTGLIVDTLSNLIAVHLYGRVPYEQTLLHHGTEQWVAAERKREWSLLTLHLVQGFSFLILETISLYLLISNFLQGITTAGDVALVVSINTILIEALWDIPQEAAQIMRALGKVVQGTRLVGIPHALRDIQHASPLRVTQGSVSFENVSFSYPSQPPLFSHLSLTIQARQKVGLVGYSGSGKSTFVHLILRIFDIQSGTITIDQQNNALVSQESLREAITFIPQDAPLFHRSIRENILYGKLDATEEEMVNAARKACVHDFISSLPQGYETCVEERGSRLSTGQRQRILMARAFLKRTDIVIMDEPTSALDSLTEAEILNAMEELTHNCTTIVIAHHLSTLLKMDRILVFDNGRIVEDGSHEVLLRHGGLYAALWQAHRGIV